MKEKKKNSNYGIVVVGLLFLLMFAVAFYKPCATCCKTEPQEIKEDAIFNLTTDSWNEINIIDEIKNFDSLNKKQRVILLIYIVLGLIIIYLGLRIFFNGLRIRECLKTSEEVIIENDELFKKED